MPGSESKRTLRNLTKSFKCSQLQTFSRSEHVSLKLSRKGLDTTSPEEAAGTLPTTRRSFRAKRRNTSGLYEF